MCSRLISLLNSLGGSWSPPVAGSGDVDGSSSNSAGEKLDIQVVRAQTNTDFWSSLSRKRSASSTSELLGAADALWKAICLKSKIPPRQRPGITLALDANRTPGLAFAAVVVVFASQFGTKARNLGFAGIYVVGPDVALVRRLA